MMYLLGFEIDMTSFVYRVRLLYPAPFKNVLNIQPLERPLKSQMVYEIQEGVMHKLSHQNTHLTFTHRKGRIFLLSPTLPPQPLAKTADN